MAVRWRATEVDGRKTTGGKDVRRVGWTALVNAESWRKDSSTTTLKVSTNWGGGWW